MSLGSRDPFTFRSAYPTERLGLVESLALSLHVLNVENMAKAYANVELHQYLHELMQGKDPRRSDWFVRYVAGR